MFAVVGYLSNQNVSDSERLNLQNLVGRTQALSSMSAEEFSPYQLELEVLITDANIRNKFAGLSTIIKITDICSDDVFSKNAHSWIRSACDNMDSICSSLQNQAFFVLKAVFNRKSSSDIKDDVKKMMPKIVGQILMSNDEILYPMQCLLAIMQNITFLDDPQTKQILLYLNSHFASADPQEMEVISSCVAHMPRLQGSNFKLFWHKQFLQISNSLLEIVKYFQLFGNIEEEQAELEGPRFNIPRPEGGDCNLAYAVKLLTCFRTICHCGVKMLSHGEAINLPMKCFMQLVINTLTTIGFIMLPTTGPENCSLTSILPSVWSDILILFEAVVRHCPGSLHSQGSKICHIVTTGLEAAESICKRFKNEHFPRAKLYKVLTSLNEKVRPVQFQKETYLLMSRMLRDAYMDFNTAQLDLKTYFQRRDSGDDRPGNIPTANNSNSYKALTRNNCIEALRALSSVVLKNKPKDYMELGVKVAALLYFIQHKKLAPPAPYDDDACREELYRLYKSVIFYFHMAFTVEHISKANIILQAGLGDPSNEINEICRDAAQFCLFIPCKLQLTMPKTSTAKRTMPASEEDMAPKRMCHFQKSGNRLPPAPLLLREKSTPASQFNDIGANSPIRTNEDDMLNHQNAGVRLFEQPEEMDQDEEEEMGGVMGRDEDELLSSVLEHQDEEAYSMAGGMEEDARSYANSVEDDEEEDDNEASDYDEEEGSEEDAEFREKSSMNFNSTSAKPDNQIENCVDNDRLQNGAASSLSRGENEVNDICEHPAVNAMHDEEVEQMDKKLTKEIELDCMGDNDISNPCPTKLVKQMLSDFSLKPGILPNDS